MPNSQPLSSVLQGSFSFIAKSLTMLVIGEVFCGIPWGVFQALTAAYASEVCPIQLPGSVCQSLPWCWDLLSSGVVRTTLNIQSDWSMFFSSVRA